MGSSRDHPTGIEMGWDVFFLKCDGMGWKRKWDGMGLGYQMGYPTHFWNGISHLRSRLLEVYTWLHICLSLCWRNVSISKSPPPQNVTFWGGVEFFFVQVFKIWLRDPGFFQRFFGHVPISPNTPHPKISICTHARHTNRFQKFQKKNGRFSEKIVMQN